MKNLAKSALMLSLANYRAEGEQALSSLYGAGDDDFDGPASSAQYVDANTRKSMGIGTINSAARLIGFTVTNDGATRLTAVLFGAYANTSAVNYGNPALVGEGDAARGIKIATDTVAYRVLLEQTKSNPILFEGLRLVAGGTSPSVQLTNIINLKHSDATGATSSQPYNPSTRLSTFQNIANIIEDSTFQFLAAGDSSMSFDVEPGTTIKFILTMKAQTDMARVLNGKSALEVSTAPAQTSGTPVIVQSSSFYGR